MTVTGRGTSAQIDMWRHLVHEVWAHEMEQRGGDDSDSIAHSYPGANTQ